MLAVMCNIRFKNLQLQLLLHFVCRHRPLPLRWKITNLQVLLTCVPLTSTGKEIIVRSCNTWRVYSSEGLFYILYENLSRWYFPLIFFIQARWSKILTRIIIAWPPHIFVLMILAFVIYLSFLHVTCSILGNILFFIIRNRSFYLGTYYKRAHQKNSNPITGKDPNLKA